MASPERRVARLVVRVPRGALAQTPASFGSAVARELGAALAGGRAIAPRARVDVRVGASASSASGELVTRVVAAVTEALR